MKAKIFSIIALAAASVLTSCNMDLKPIGSLDENDAILSTNDAKRFRNMFYVTARGFSSSPFLTYADIQTDMFNGIVINGNRMGTLANGTVLSSDGDISGYWSTLWYYVNNANYFLATVQPLYEQAVAENKEEDAAQYARYIGEAHFFRGFFYAEMMDRWCVQYTPEVGAKDGTGLPVVTEYNPTSDRSKYPGRGTMDATIAFIKQELNLALEAMQKWEADNDGLAPMSPYINSMTVRAMQSRLSLWIGDYDTAISKANEVINSGVYTMTTPKTFPNMWSVDEGTEVIFMPYESNQELGGSIGLTWLSIYNNMADYIPSVSLITDLQRDYNRLTKAGDIRYSTYIGTRNLTTNFGTIGTPCFNKFPGNPALMTSSTPNVVNKPKTFRLSELYLIIAEAAYNKGDNKTANDALKVIKENRYTQPANFAGYPDLSGHELIEEIQLQRGLELVGEGFRLSDLRRWKMGFTRTGGYEGMNTIGMTGVDKDEIGQILTPAGLEVVYAPDDHRYTWPIPSDELNVNPQMEGQQNPGY